MAKNWGECYFDHYEKFFGRLRHRELFRQNSSSPSIQILEFNTNDSAKIFASLGLTHYPQEVGPILEVFTFSDDAWDKVPYLLASALFYAVQHKMTMGWGMVIGNLEVIYPQFVQRWGKNSLYFTHPYVMPPDGQSVSCEATTGYLLEAFFVTEKENEFFRHNGAVAFEQLLEDKNADVFMLGRQSVV